MPKNKKLIELLQKLDPEAEVIMSSDAEGNRFNEWSGDYGTGNWDEEDQEFSSEAEDENGNSIEHEPGDINAIVLWPS